VTAASLPRIWQHEASMPIPRIVQSRAILRQHAGRALGCIASRQADAGSAVHKTTAASISNAPFLPQFMLVVSHVQL
jgi:hypothetical protein